MSTDPNAKTTAIFDVETSIIYVLFVMASASLIAAGSIVLNALLTG